MFGKSETEKRLDLAIELITEINPKNKDLRLMLLSILKYVKTGDKNKIINELKSIGTFDGDEKPSNREDAQ